jgi:hypothetical protein
MSPKSSLNLNNFSIISGHQPAYLPWLGLLHKASLADTFVFMDDVQYLERDWQNRNQIKVSEGKSMWLTVPVDLKASASRRICDILIKQEDGKEKDRWNFRHWRALQASYGRAPYFSDYSEYFKWLYLEKSWVRLADLNLAILQKVFEWFEVDTQIVMGSEQNFCNKKSDLVLEHGRRFNADVVVTGILGRDYIDVASFGQENIEVLFQDYQHPVYQQRFGSFLSHLSFIDLLFNCGPMSREIAFAGNVSKEELWKTYSKH